MEWVEKVSFARLNKLFGISTSERDHQVLLSDNNLQALVKESKSFILPILPCLAPQSLVLGKHYLLKDLPFYEVARVVDSKAHQACLEQRDKKHHERTLKQASATNCSTSNSTISLPTKKKKERACCSACSECKDSSPSTSSSSSSSSFSTDNTEPKTGVELVVSHIVYEEEEEEDIATNLRVGFKERQRKRLSESITVNPTPFKKPYLKPISMHPISALTSMPVPLTTVGGIIPNPNEMLPST